MQYRQLDDFPDYAVGDDGSVWSRKIKGSRSRAIGKWRQLVIGYNRSGYAQVRLIAGTKRTTKRVNRLILRAFTGDGPAGYDCCHNNGIKGDNRLENLRWDTKAGNHSDKVRHGTHNRGERNHRARLTEVQVCELRRHASSYATKSLADQYGIHARTVRDIVTRRRWGHI